MTAQNGDEFGGEACGGIDSMAAQIMGLWNASVGFLTAPGAPYHWTVHDIDAQPIRLYDTAPSDMNEVWQSTRDFAADDYLIYGDERLTYSQAHDIVDSLARYLASRGVTHGDRVAIAMRNYPEFILTYWATLRLGAVVVGMNAWWVGPEFRYGLTDSTPKVLVCDQERLAIAAQVVPGVRQELAADGDPSPLPVVCVRCQPGPLDDAITFDEAVAVGAVSDLNLDTVAPVAPQDPACIFYTSGTTGFPKGAVLTHRSCVANLWNMRFAVDVLKTAQLLAAGADPNNPPPPDPTAPQPAALLATPLFHVTANNCGLHPVTAQGGKVALLYRWDATDALEVIQRERITSLSTVPVMARELVEHPNFSDYDTSSVLTLGGGGAAVQPDLVTKIDESTESAPATGYGLTETSGIVSFVGGPFFSLKSASVGPPAPVIEAKIVDPLGDSVIAGEVGELWVRGPNNVAV